MTTEATTHHCVLCGHASNDHGPEGQCQAHVGTSGTTCDHCDGTVITYHVRPDGSHGTRETSNPTSQPQCPCTHHTPLNT